jgi:hypothetical protein
MNDGINNVGTAYVLWLGCLLQLHGLHRLYNGKIFTGLLWMFSFGLFGIGQLVDLLLIPNMVQEHNDKVRERYGLSPAGAPLIKPEVQKVILEQNRPTERLASSQLMVQLLKAAENRGGRLTVAQGDLETGASFSEVETAIRAMVQSGYVEISREPTWGVIIPEFKSHTNQLTVELLKAAYARGGKISVTQGVMLTGQSFADVESALKDMVRTGYVDVGNDPESGVVMYEFKEL